MDSIARGLTALSPSIGAAEDFISKKGIPEEQVPAFLAKLGDPMLAGLIAQKQRLKQEQAKQIPPGGPQQSPPTVRDEINQKLAQILQGQQQGQLQGLQNMQNAQQGQGQPQQGGQPQGGPPQQGGQPPQGQPPQGGPPPQGAPQGGPPVQAAAGGLMGMGLGGLDAGAMEAPRHFDGGGVVAFTAGGTAPKTKEELEEERKKAMTSSSDEAYANIFKLGQDYLEDLRGSSAYHQIAGTEEDPSVKLEREQMAKDAAEGKQRYGREHGYDAEMAGWMRGLSGAFRGESLGQSLTANYDETIKARKAADDKYDTLNSTLDKQNLALAKAMTAARDSNSKADYDHAEKIRGDIRSTVSAMANTQLDKVKFDTDRSDHATDIDFKKQEIALRQKQLDMEKQQLYKPTDQANAALAYFNSLKARKAEGDPELVGKSDAELRGMAYEKAQSAGLEARLSSADRNNLLDNYRYFQDAVDKANAALRRALGANGGDKNAPAVVAAQKAVDEATSMRNQMQQQLQSGSSTPSSVSSSPSSSSRPTMVFDNKGQLVSGK
jgi:hypothetical protein